MSLKVYIDEPVDHAITSGLRRRRVDVLTVQEDGNAGLDDIGVLDRASELGRVVFTNDTDFLKEARRRQHDAEAFASVIYAHPIRVPVGRCVDDLELISSVYEPDEYVERVE